MTALACYGLLDDAALILAVALLVAAVGWALQGVEIEGWFGDPPPKDKP